MENATKALLIAGGVLLAMMILATGIILYNSFSNTASSYTTRMDLNEKTKFNSNFEIYKGRDDITAQDIVTLINMVEEYSKKTDINVEITVNGNAYNNGWGATNGSIQFLQDNLEKTFKYIDNSIDYDEEGKVKSIKFTINTP